MHPEPQQKLPSLTTPLQIHPELIPGHSPNSTKVYSFGQVAKCEAMDSVLDAGANVNKSAIGVWS